MSDIPDNKKNNNAKDGVYASIPILFKTTMPIDGILSDLEEIINDITEHLELSIAKWICNNIINSEDINIRETYLLRFKEITQYKHDTIALKMLLSVIYVNTMIYVHSIMHKIGESKLLFCFHDTIPKTVDCDNRITFIEAHLGSEFASYTIREILLNRNIASLCCIISKDRNDDEYKRLMSDIGRIISESLAKYLGV